MLHHNLAESLGALGFSEMYPSRMIDATAQLLACLLLGILPSWDSSFAACRTGGEFGIPYAPQALEILKACCLHLQEACKWNITWTSSCRDVLNQTLILWMMSARHGNLSSPPTLLGLLRRGQDSTRSMPREFC
jgi:hypothetical protein